MTRKLLVIIALTLGSGSAVYAGGESALSTGGMASGATRGVQEQVKKSASEAYQKHKSDLFGGMETGSKLAKNAPKDTGAAAIGSSSSGPGSS
jgi:hypothetical protein